MNNYSVVYDFANETFRYGDTLEMLGFIVVGCIIFGYNYRNRKNLAKRPTAGMIFGIFFVGFSLITAIISIPSDIREYIKVKTLYKNGQLQITEGEVTDFTPMPYGGHQDESFKINNIFFHYSDYDESYYGFNNAKSHGGPIDEGKFVRISYITEKSGGIGEERNIILRIEVIK
jgi:hypothetical protein